MSQHKTPQQNVTVGNFASVGNPARTAAKLSDMETYLRAMRDPLVCRIVEEARTAAADGDERALYLAVWRHVETLEHLHRLTNAMLEARRRRVSA